MVWRVLALRQVAASRAGWTKNTAARIWSPVVEIEIKMELVAATPNGHAKAQDNQVSSWYLK